MNIAHAVLRYPPARGGVEEFVGQLVARTRASGGFDAAVYTSTLSHHRPRRTLASTARASDPPYVHRHATWGLPFISYPILKRLTAALMQSDADIMHGHGFWYHPADTAARVAKRKNVPFIFHPYYAEHGPRLSLKWQWYKSHIGRRTFAAADVVCVISPQEQELIERSGLPVKRFALVHPAIDHAEFSTPATDPYPALGVHGSPIVLFAGRIAKEKGVDILLRAFVHVLKAFPDAQLVVLGEDFGDRAYFTLLGERLHIAHQVTWAGNVKRAILIAAMQHADIFVLPSRYEAFGIVLAEAQAAATPVIATNASAMPFVAKDGEGALLFEQDNVDDLAEKMNHFLADDALRQKTGAAGQARMQKFFTWDRTMTQLRSVYTSVQ